MSDQQAHTILVVDDDPALQRLIVALLQRAGMSPKSAMNATDARTILEQDPLPDLMVLDIMLPEISGIDFLRELRSDDRYGQLPVIVLSALGNPEQIKEGLISGANRYLTKPYLAQNLVRTIRDMIEPAAG